MFEGVEFVYHAYKDWVLMGLLVSLIFVLYDIYLKPLYFMRLANSLVNLNATQKLLDEKNSITNRISWTLDLVFYVNSSLMLFLLVEFLHIQVPGSSAILRCLLIFGAVVIVVLGRLLIYFCVGWMSDRSKIQSEYASYWMMLNKVFGLFLFPCVLCVLYLPINDTEIIFIVCLVVYVLLYLAKLFRGMQISIRNRLSLFSIILYLCALEIMPVGMLIKYLMSE